KSTDKFYEVTRTLTEAGINVNSNDTICRQVSNRDRDLRHFATQYDKIIFVSGTKSSNGKVLYDICKQSNPDTYFVSRREQIEKSWFNQGDTIGICGATSTPMWLMEQVEEELKKY
ncbi:MAG: 4-hydroxy-3-methylbut-2-enyl diphosphate reductase, partial [Cyclobacteriaceae bacterium]